MAYKLSKRVPYEHIFLRVKVFHVITPSLSLAVANNKTRRPLSPVMDDGISLNVCLHYGFDTLKVYKIATEKRM